MKLVIFDCDGTIVDSQIGIVAAMNHAFESVGLTPPTRAQTLSAVGLSLPEAFAYLAPEHPEALRSELAAVYRSDFVYAKKRAMCTEPLYPGAGEVLATLMRRDDVLLGMATGKSQRGVARIVERERWQGWFTSVQTADENPSKPHPGMIEAAMRQAGVEPSATVMIGDTTYDMTMAINAGVAALGVTWGYHDRAALERAGAHRIVSGYRDVLGAIEELLGGDAGASEADA